MNAREDTKPRIVAARMKHWLDIATCPLLDTRVPTWKARRNFLNLIKRYPEIAAQLGVSRVDLYPEVRSLKPKSKVTPPTAPHQSAPAAPPPTPTLDRFFSSQASLPPPEGPLISSLPVLEDAPHASRIDTNAPMFQDPTNSPLCGWCDHGVAGGLPCEECGGTGYDFSVADPLSQIDTWEGEGGASPNGAS